jgi:hypothetical protein
MEQEIGLLVNGLPSWYKNIQDSFEEHGSTWLQQTKKIKDKFRRHFEELIKERGYFFVFGYVQRSGGKIIYRFKVSEIISDYQRIPPPDETAPPYSSYDHTQGGCTDENDFRYKTWLRVIGCERVRPIEKEKLIVETTGNPVPYSPREPHYYILIPSDLQRGGTNMGRFNFTPKWMKYRKKKPSDFSDGVVEELLNYIALSQGTTIMTCKTWEKPKQNRRIFLLPKQSPSDYSPSIMGRELLEKYRHIQKDGTRYIAEIKEVLEVPGKNLQFWKELCNIKEFDIWKPEEPHRLFSLNTRRNKSVIWILLVYRMPFDIVKGIDFEQQRHHAWITNDETLSKIQEGFALREFTSVCPDFERRMMEIKAIVDKYTEGS